MLHIRILLTALLFTIISSGVAYQWLDRPISAFVHDQFFGIRIFSDIVEIPAVLAAIVNATFVIVGIYVILRRPLTKLASVLFLSGISIVVASHLKDELKFVFGRTFPETYFGNVSLVRDGVYGFNLFHGGNAYASFPSGHMTVICALVAVLWVSYPRFRSMYGILVAIVAIGLIGANYHFLSDVIAGGFLGASTGFFAVLLWEAEGLPRVVSERFPAS